MVSTVGDMAELPETAHGASLAHSAAGQWVQSEWLERFHEGIDR